MFTYDNYPEFYLVVFVYEMFKVQNVFVEHIPPTTSHIISIMRNFNFKEFKFLVFFQVVWIPWQLCKI